MSVKCGECRYFIRDGKCGWMASEEGKKKHPFEHAPFWVWSDCYSDREQVRAGVTSACPTFEPKAYEARATADGQSGPGIPLDPPPPQIIRGMR